MKFFVRTLIYLLSFFFVALSISVYPSHYIHRFLAPLYFKNIKKLVLTKKFISSRIIESIILSLPILHNYLKPSEFICSITDNTPLEDNKVRIIIKENLGVDIKNIYILNLENDYAFTCNGYIFISQKLLNDVKGNSQSKRNVSLAIIAHEYAHTLQKGGSSEEYCKKHITKMHLQTIISFVFLRSLKFLVQVTKIRPSFSYIKSFFWAKLQNELTFLRYLKQIREHEHEADTIKFIVLPEKRLLYLNSLSNFLSKLPENQDLKCDFPNIMKEIYSTHPSHKNRISHIKQEQEKIIAQFPELQITVPQKD